MKVTVTGGAGYIGCVLVPKLLEAGHEVTVFDKLFFGKEGLSDVEGRIDVIQGDIREFPDDILKGQDAVVHLAAFSNDPTAEYNPQANREINHRGAVNVAKACVKHGISRFVMASSCSVYYSPTPTEEMMDETTPVNPTAPYSKSKRDAEIDIMNMASKDFHPCFLRKGTVYGASPKMRYDLVVNVMVRNAYQNGVMKVFSGGEMYRPLVDVNDVCKAYLTCLKADEDMVSGEVFNVLHKNYIILALAHWLKHVLRDKKDIQVDVDYETGNTRSYRVDNKKAQEVLGLRCNLGITQAAQDIWSRIESGEISDFQNPMYYNIKWLELLVEMQDKLKGFGKIL